MTDHNDFEELEQIPWASLAAQTPDPKARYLSLVAVAIVVVAAVGWLALRGGGAPAVAALAATSTTTPAAVPVPVTVAETTTTEPVVYSEADLMSIDVGGEERLAVAQAEWLVRDYLTVDGDSLVANRISALLPATERDTTGTYVEWVKAFRVTTAEPGRYRVEVVYRLLGETADGFVRQPAGALAVALSIDIDGTTRLEATLEEIPVPVLLGLEG
jgi:hypothetical protein